MSVMGWFESRAARAAGPNVLTIPACLEHHTIGHADCGSANLFRLADVNSSGGSKLA
jgi:hypothetical protein